MLEPAPEFVPLRLSVVPTGFLQQLVVHLAIPRESRAAWPSPPYSLPSKCSGLCGVLGVGAKLGRKNTGTYRRDREKRGEERMSTRTP